ncbi:TetR/AcrR family transcriptional regulator [soil metagenome]
MGRARDVERRAELLDAVVGYLAQHGLAGVSLRPMAKELGVSVNALVHHFGSKEELVVEALQRAAEIQEGITRRWWAREPDLTQADVMRKWWRWMNRDAENLALVRLGIEAAALDATVSGLPGEVRAAQIGYWRAGIESRLVADGVPAADAAVEASLVKAMFTGLVTDLLASGQRQRLTISLEVGLARLEALTRGPRRKPPSPAPAPSAKRNRETSGLAEHESGRSGRVVAES